MTTLVTRFSGPMQAWPSHSRGNRRPTYRAPTYSGVVGFFKAALGMGRDHASDPLESCSIAIRIDRVPQFREDYHTINPMPDPANRFSRVRHQKPQMLRMSGGPYHETVLTFREYLHDGDFLCFIEADRSTIHGLEAAVRSPRWATYLGRKACVPSTEVVVGVFDLGLEKTLQALPVVTTNAASQVTREVHWLASEANSASSSESWVDQPNGPVGAAYRSRPRSTGFLDFPVVPNRSEFRTWVNNQVSAKGSNIG